MKDLSESIIIVGICFTIAVMFSTCKFTEEQTLRSKRRGMVVSMENELLTEEQRDKLFNEFIIGE